MTRLETNKLTSRNHSKPVATAAVLATGSKLVAPNTTSTISITKNHSGACSMTCWK